MQRKRENGVVARGRSGVKERQEWGVGVVILRWKIVH